MVSKLYVYSRNSTSSTFRRSETICMVTSTCVKQEVEEAVLRKVDLKKQALTSECEQSLKL